MPEIQFKGKEFVFNHHLSVPYRPLVPHKDKSIGAGNINENLVIHGDNLHALKALMPMYAGKIDCIFIDPPYNTGNEKWAYNDNVNSPMIKEWLNSNPVNKDDMLRHDKWLAMMYPRLKLLHELLSDDGIIYICIGDDEQHRLRAMLDEIFGENQFVACFVWQSRAKPTNIGEAKLKPQNDAEYIFAYEKVKDKARFNLVNSGFARSYPHKDKDGNYRLQTILKSNRGENKRETMRDTIAGYTPPTDQRWQGGKDFIQGLYDTNRLEFRDGTPFRKYYEHEESDEHAPFYCFVSRENSSTAEAGKVYLNQVVGNQHDFDTVKPIEVVEYLLKRSTKSSSIVLDSFAGSGTTANAVLNLNSKDKGERKFIMIECENYVEQLTIKRIANIINGYSYSGKLQETLFSQSITFSSLKKADKLLEQVAGIENLEEHNFDSIKKEIKDGILTVIGEKKITEQVDGTGGSFTYCTLGEPIDIDKILTGENLPEYQAIGSWLFHTATGEALDVANIKEQEFFLGESNAYCVWLIYKPELEFLKSRDSALTLAFAEKIANNKNKKHLVFAPAKFVPNKSLLPLGVEYAPLPFALYRVEK